MQENITLPISIVTNPTKHALSHVEINHQKKKKISPIQITTKKMGSLMNLSRMERVKEDNFIKIQAIPYSLRSKGKKKIINNIKNYKISLLSSNQNWLK